MPWFNYREMTDEDLAAIFAYTRTLKPIRNEGSSRCHRKPRLNKGGQKRHE